MPALPARLARRAARVSSAAIVLVAMSLVGCSAPAEEDPAETAPLPVRTDEMRPADPPPEFVPDGSAADNLPVFRHVLQEYADGKSPVEGQPIVDAIVAAGFDRTAMQVTFDRSKTNLVADSIMVSVLIGEDCLIGQVVTADRSVTAAIEPALTDAKNICLIGNTRAIDW